MSESVNEQYNRFLQEKLEERKANGLLRTLVYTDGQIDFSSNDYFGFSKKSELDFHLAAGVGGSTGSRSITGNSQLAEKTEQMIAAFHQREAALIFNTGYMANVGLFSCMAGKGDTYISDEYIHASMIDGMRLSYANRLKFKHNNLEDLEKKLRLTTGRKIVAIESIYSMDGDEAPLKAIANLCKQYGALLVVDEAHATGIFGDKGEGLVGKYGLENEVFASVHTFGKALGLHGAVVIGSQVLRQYLINNARSFIFTTALPPHSYLPIQAAYRLLPDADRNQLNQLISYFRKGLTTLAPIQFLESHSPIQGVLLFDNFKAKALATHLIEKGIFVRPILSPTVPPGKERLRICLHSFNTLEQIDLLLNEIKAFLA